MYNIVNRAEVEFEYIDEIGQEGNNSNVFKAHDKQLDDIIAIKQIPINHFCDPNEYFNESKNLNLSSHKNIVNIKYACKDKQYIYIAMPYYSKGSLNKIINNRYLTSREIITFSLQIVSGLHNIHTKKLIHFDIKPDNILLSDSNEAIISDFGLAKPTNLSGIANQDINYIKQRPPEAFDFDHFDLRYDIYQLGITIYRMCFGNKEFYSQFNKYLETPHDLDRHRFKYACKNAEFPDRNFFLPHIPLKLRKIIKKCLEVSPDKRYNSVLEVANELSSIDGNLLDWNYYQDNNINKYVKLIEDKKISIELSNSSSIAKKEFNNGNIQRIQNYCKLHITNKELLEFLESH